MNTYKYRTKYVCYACFLETCLCFVEYVFENKTNLRLYRVLGE